MISRIVLPGFIFIFLSNHVEAQELITTGKIWSIVKTNYQDSSQKSFENLRFTDETEVAGKKYWITERSLTHKSSEWFSYGLTREDMAKRVFFRFLPETSEYLIYDFNAKRNDTIRSTGIFTFNNKEFIIPVTYLVKSTDSVYIGKKRMKRLNLAEIHSPYYICERWIESIGSMSGLFHNSDGRSDRDIYSLQYVTENDRLIYQLPGNLAGSPESDKQKKKNPGVSFIIRDSSEVKMIIRTEPPDKSGKFRVKISTVAGQTAFSATFSNMLTIEKSFGKPGFYYAEFSDEQGYRQYLKFPLK